MEFEKEYAYVIEITLKEGRNGIHIRVSIFIIISEKIKQSHLESTARQSVPSFVAKFLCTCVVRIFIHSAFRICSCTSGVSYQ
jgi:hypothetical protein